jgi:hypothetical protein
MSRYDRITQKIAKALNLLPVSDLLYDFQKRKSDPYQVSISFNINPDATASSTST